MAQSESKSTADFPAIKRRTNTGAAEAVTKEAYLVLRSAGRWSDLFRLSRTEDAVIGRSSSNQIAVRSDQASRRHARVRYVDGCWQVEDLGSRNGTTVNGQHLTGPHTLADGDVIGVAGFEIVFSHSIDFERPGAEGSAEPAQATDDQITMGMDATSITERRRFSSHLHAKPTLQAPAQAPSRALLQLAFSLARTDSIATSAEAVLEVLAERNQSVSGGVYVWDPVRKPRSLEQARLAATRQPEARSYSRPPDSLVGTVLADEGHAVLARNVAGNEELATEDARGEMNIQSLILAPARDSSGQSLGLIHLTSSSVEAELGTDDLELAVAAAEILGESLANLVDRKRLDRSLRQSRRQVAELQRQLGDRVRIVGKSRTINEVNRQISLVAPTPTTVLIRGESGVGKELVAAAMHHASPRRDGPLVCLNCAALSETLLESELFGHEKGAFTGATERKQGKFEAADGGTLMLDEIGEMNGELQAKLLRVLEGHTFERVGGHERIRADVRVVAATNRDLQAMVREGRFRQDLYYRLNVVEILVPPLRERGDDCLAIADHFLNRFNREMGRKITGFTDAAKSKLLDYPWPGNIRELKNVIERAVVLNTSEVVDADDLVLSPAVSGQEQAAIPSADAVELSLADLERRHIERVLRHTRGNKSRASAILGIERSTLDRKLKKFARQ